MNSFRFSPVCDCFYVDQMCLRVVGQSEIGLTALIVFLGSLRVISLTTTAVVQLYTSLCFEVYSKISCKRQINASFTIDRAARGDGCR